MVACDELVLIDGSVCPLICVCPLSRRTLKVTHDGERKWAAGGGGPGNLFNFFLFLDSWMLNLSLLNLACCISVESLL